MSEAPPFLPYGRQTVENDDIAAVARVLKSDFLTTGPEVAVFEDAFAARVGTAHAVAASSGTAALHLAALALGLGPGDTVIVPSITFVATANAARYVGAEVTFTDVDPETGLMGATELSAALARAPEGTARAVFPVHLNGQPCYMPDIGALAETRGLSIVEDACHALGGTIGAHRVGDGHFSAMAMFSLHPVKAIAMGEGGVLTTSHPDIDRRLRRLRNHGLVSEAEAFRDTAAALDAEGRPNPWYYELHEPGFNYRASDIHCALGLSQLGKLDRFLARRCALADLYDAALANLAPVLRPVPRVPWGTGGWHLYPVLVDFEAAGLERAALMAALRERGIGTQVHYIPVHRQPYYAERYGRIELPGAERYYARCLSLPLFPAMADCDVARVADALHALLPH
jgi:UDP-4-amino-4,6-dideoxy-N-acetyl-beta-L-altrosamine transaminase